MPGSVVTCLPCGSTHSDRSSGVGATTPIEALWSWAVMPSADQRAVCGERSGRRRRGHEDGRADLRPARDGAELALDLVVVLSVQAPLDGIASTNRPSGKVIRTSTLWAADAPFAKVVVNAAVCPVVTGSGAPVRVVVAEIESADAAGAASTVLASAARRMIDRRRRIA